MRKTIVNSQSAAFVAPSNVFRYNGSEYTTFTLPLKWTAQEFIADSGGNGWVPLGSVAPGATFS